jgi:hypothetical protein
MIEYAVSMPVTVIGLIVLVFCAGYDCAARHMDILFKILSGDNSRE